jgi:hypothetical protein
LTIHTIQGVREAIERLGRRDAASLANFIVSLVQDTGPIGDQVRTFIVGDDVAETTESIKDRIGALRARRESDYRRRLGQDIGERLEFILDSIESLVLPIDPKRAFELLVLIFESDAKAMENCTDHDYEVSCAFEHAAELISQAVQSLRRPWVVETLSRLLGDDNYGVRQPLAEVIRGLDAIR